MRAVTAIASPPLARMPAATSSHGPWLRAEIATLAPASANASAIARPMPRDDPVTIATLPERSNRFMAVPRRLVKIDPRGRVEPGHGEICGLHPLAHERVAQGAD